MPDPVQPARPNVLVLYVDQLRWDCIGAHGNPEVHTPNLDRLIQRGVSFNGFCQHPLCMPSRASFLTGKYPSQLGIYQMGVPMSEDVPNWAHYFSNLGYRTNYFGKLHFLPHANRDHRCLHPKYGWDRMEVSDEPGVYHDAYHAWVRNHFPEDLELIHPGYPPATVNWMNTLGMAFARDDKDRMDVKNAPVSYGGSDKSTHTAFVAQKTMEWLEQEASAESCQRFLTVASFYAPHPPWIVPQRFLDLYNGDDLNLDHMDPEVLSKSDPIRRAFLREAKKGYYASISEIDEWVGKILAAMESCGRDRDTAIVFVSDHGEFLGEFGLFGKSWPAPDACTRVPLALIPPVGRSFARSGYHPILAEGVDVLPTLLELADAQVPPDLPGRSLVPVLRGDLDKIREFCLTEGAEGDGRVWRRLRSAEWSYLRDADGVEHLHDMRQPYGESRDLSADPQCREVLQAFRDHLLDTMFRMERPSGRIWVY
jgi:arylsulfatase A-like enzyme